MIGLHQAALDYNDMGWPIFRLQPKGKTPIGGTRGRDDASTDTILVNRWWTVTQIMRSIWIKHFEAKRHAG